MQAAVSPVNSKAGASARAGGPARIVGPSQGRGGLWRQWGRAAGPTAADQPGRIASLRQEIEKSAGSVFEGVDSPVTPNLYTDPRHDVDALRADPRSGALLQIGTDAILLGPAKMAVLIGPEAAFAFGVARISVRAGFLTRE